MVNPLDFIEVPKRVVPFTKGMKPKKFCFQCNAYLGKSVTHDKTPHRDSAFTLVEGFTKTYRTQDGLEYFCKQCSQDRPQLEELKWFLMG